MNKNKPIILKTIIFISIILLIILTNFIINSYNEQTPINITTDEIKELQQKYQITITNTYSILERICTKENDIYVLKDKYKTNNNYSSYNNLILKISNSLNSKDNLLLLEKNQNTITYKNLDFTNRVLNYKNIINNLNDNQNDKIINSYINTIANLITINCEEDYYNSKKINLFNLSGKTVIYNDYKKLIDNEFEIINAIYNIVEYIEKSL